MELTQGTSRRGENLTTTAKEPFEFVRTLESYQTGKMGSRWHRDVFQLEDLLLWR